MILSVPCQGQANAVAKRSPDGSLTVEFEGKKYRGITGAQLDQWEVSVNDLQTCRDNEVTRIQIIETAKRDVIIAQQQRDIEHGSFIHTMQMYERERELRTQAMSQIVPHGEVKGLGGFLLKAIDSPFGQFAIKVAAPLLTTIKVMKQ
jgi:hypothetical protein